MMPDEDRPSLAAPSAGRDGQIGSKPKTAPMYATADKTAAALELIQKTLRQSEKDRARSNEDMTAMLHRIYESVATLYRQEPDPALAPRRPAEPTRDPSPAAGRALQSEDQSEILWLRELVESKDQDIASLQEELQEATRDSAELSTRIKKLEISAAGKVTDSEIRELWGQMEFNIRNLVRVYLADAPFRPTKRGEMRLSRYFHGWDRLEADQDGMSHILEACLWRKITRLIFDGGWGETAAKYDDLKSMWFKLLQYADKHPDTLERSSLWKAHGSALANMISAEGDDGDRATINATLLAQVISLKQLVDLDGLDGLDELGSAALNYHLAEINQQARKLDEILMESKAAFRIVWMQKEVSESGTEFICLGPDGKMGDGRYREICGVIRPALLKYGNADGEFRNPAVPSVIVPMQILCF